MRGLIHLTVLLTGLVPPAPVASGPPRPLAIPAAEPELEIELARRNRGRRVVRELLGRNRTRSVNLTRFEMDAYRPELSPGPASNRAAIEEAEEVLLSAFVRVTRERFERDLRLKERYDHLRGVRHRGGDRKAGSGGRPRVRFSPRAYFGDDGALVGGKLRLRGLRSPLWSRAGLDVTHELDGDNLRLRFSLDRQNWSSFVVYHSNRGGHGASAALGISRSF